MLFISIQASFIGGEMKSRKIWSFRNLPYVFSIAFMLASIVTGIIPARPGSADDSVPTDTSITTDTSAATDTLAVTDTSVPTDTMTETETDTSPVVGNQLFFNNDRFGPPSTKTPTLTATNTPTKTSTKTPTNTLTKTSTKTPTNTTVPDYRLNLSHILCVNGQVEIHFVLLNVPDGITPGTLTYTYGSIAPGSHTGNVWHYFDYQPSGYYDVTSASVVVDGVTVTLHNPDVYANTYTCGPTATFTRTSTSTNTSTPTSTGTPATSSPTFTSTFTSTNTFTPTNTSTSTSTFTATFTATSIPPSIEASYCYSLVLSEFRINVVNSGPAGFVGYSYDGGTTILSTSIDAGATITILIPQTATSVLLYVKANAGDDWSGPVQTLELDQKNVCEEDPMSVVFTCSGDSGTPSAWLVENQNNFDVKFTWTIVGGPSSSGEIDLPALASYSFETAYYSGEMQIYVNGVLQAHAFASNCNPPPSVVKLQLVPLCSANPGSFNAWRVINPNEVALNFEWNIDTTAISGVGNVPANSHVDLLTPVQRVRDVLLLYRGGVSQANALAATNCARTVTTPVPNPSPTATVPVTGTPAVLIPVTGVDLSGSGIPLSHTFFNLSLGFFGLGLVLSAFGRKQK
jgi:hypothetical protein